MNDVDNRRPPGADSVTWRRFGHLSGLFLAGTGLLLQVAHPVVGAGVLQHSEFKARPWRRAVRTHLSTMRFIYGIRPGAAHEGDRLPSRLRTGARLSPAPSGLPAAAVRSAAPNRKSATPLAHQLTGRAT